MAFKMKGFSAFTKSSDARKLFGKKKSKARIEFTPGKDDAKYYDDEGKEYTEYWEGEGINQKRRNVNDPVPSPNRPSGYDPDRRIVLDNITPLKLIEQDDIDIQEDKRKKDLLEEIEGLKIDRQKVVNNKKIDSKRKEAILKSMDNAVKAINNQLYKSK